MDKNLLRAEEICRIIKACKQAGVNKFEYFELKLEFFGEDSFSFPQTSFAKTWQKQNIKSFKDNVEASSTDAVAVDEKTLAEAEDAYLMIDDPFEYERLQIARQIEQERHHDAQA